MKRTWVVSPIAFFSFVAFLLISYPIPFGSMIFRKGYLIFLFGIWSYHSLAIVVYCLSVNQIEVNLAVYLSCKIVSWIALESSSGVAGVG